MKNRVYTLSLLLLFISTSSFSQEIYGLWEVKSITSKEEAVKPMASWYRINQANLFESGHGWLQTSKGTYKYDEKKSTLIFKDPRGIKDDFGAYKVSFYKGKMIWKREEEDVLVKITLEPIIQIPESPADLVHGIWRQSEYIVNMASNFSDNQGESEIHLFLNWDRKYIRWDENGQKSIGYWQMDANKPTITFLPEDVNKRVNSWMVEADNETLELKGIGEENSNTIIRFKRKDSFPK